ncbi:MAG: Fe2+-dependent dioxygenase [Gammaproteobacteria bacterium]|nr:Fe2+-dependent dioxygenase [Gammaproteobacteria bacterium]
MLVEIPAVLPAENLTEIQKLLAAAPFVDGKLSAGDVARQVKNNSEMQHTAAQLNRLNHLVMSVLVQHPQFQSAVLPHRIAMPFYARYTVGQAYGEHIDDPVMGPAGQRYRSDIAVTVFLNAPQEYDGGELVIATQYGQERIKCPAGHAVIYPASSLHQVTPVRAGQRLVAVTWVQSLIRNPAQRELLYELNHVRERWLKTSPADPDTQKIDHTYVNLVRMWSEL